ncbi:hypothetical protein OSB04_026246 [Centaurea solstitialis]|uniref:Pectinesterase inhibitor domain-containing protein n=1 Tax=Centaurea solstitialis TaxID=347529 RepID=A0AA38SP39_9ASTR|nr:hypothetical protein OSB04_026246 [Centaurea solstitialis]
MNTTFLITLFLTTLLSISTSISSQQTTTYTTFIKTSCNSATYPAVCRKSLLPYAAAVKSNPLKLVNAALSATLRSANATISTASQFAKAKRITKWESAVLKDCIENLKDSMAEIKSSLKAISGIPRSADKSFLISNAQTWTSAAITDEETCLDGFADRRISPATAKRLRNSIVSLARVSSNALYLINHLKV